MLMIEFETALNENSFTFLAEFFFLSFSFVTKMKFEHKEMDHAFNEKQKQKRVEEKERFLSCFKLNAFNHGMEH